MSGPTNGTGTIDFASDDDNDTGREVDAATYVAAAIFNSVALPAGMPDFIKAAIESKAAYAQKLEGSDAFTIGGAGGGSLDNLTREQRQKKTEDEAFEYLATVSEAAEREEQRERERDAWARTKSTVGGVSMTGAEWAKLADRLRNDDDLRRRILDAFTERGMTDDEAQARYDRVTQVAGIAAIPPSQRSDEQKQIIAKADADPTFKRDMQDVDRLASKKELTVRSELHGSFVSASNGTSSQPVDPATDAVMPKVVPVATVQGPGF